MEMQTDLWALSQTLTLTHTHTLTQLLQAIQLKVIESASELALAPHLALVLGYCQAQFARHREIVLSWRLALTNAIRLVA